MAKQFSLKIFFILLWTGILFVLSLFFTNKVSAQPAACSLEGYSPPITPIPELCGPYFSGIDERSSNPPCNSSLSCDNKEYIRKTCKRIGIGGVDATTCCQELGFNFCDQKDLGPEIILRYQFRCCFRPTPTPTPTLPCPGPGCPTPTPTPIPCSLSSGGDGWAETCTDRNGTRNDTCSGNRKVIYFCDSNNLCSESSLSSTCPSGSSCSVKSTGEPVCIAPTPTPTPIPCSNWNSCTSCIAIGQGRANNCGWKNGSVCQSGTASCPVDTSSWNYSNCSVNECAVPTPTPTPTGIPTPTPTACQVTTSPSVHNLAVSRTGTVTASVTSGLGGATIRQMRFGSYNTSIATVNPTSDSSFTYSTTVTAIAQGATAVWGTADLSDGRICQSSGATDTDINVSTVTPTPTRIPTPTPTPIPAGLAAQQERCNSTGTAWIPITNVCVAPSSCSVPPAPTPTPTPIPPPPPPSFYSIGGKIFNDVNTDGKSNGDSDYTGSITITRSPNLGIYSSPLGTGIYSFTNLPPGQYTITFSGLPQGLEFTYPPTSLIVQVGPGCSVPITSEGTCIGNSIINLNAGVTTSTSAWFQSAGSDMRWDSGFSNTLPRNKYASILGSGGMPGIIFSGTISPSFGEGSASQTNWKVSGNASDNRDVFTDTHSLIPTSYRFLLETVDSSAIAKKGVRDLCSGGADSTNCTLTTNLSNGVYKIDGNLNLSGSGYTFPANKDFVILINGNLNINEKIHVPVSATVIFSASGNITVNRVIGEAASSTAQTIEGLYSADTNFVADGNNNCSITPDLRLNIGGSVIANAGRGNGTFVNNRDLCRGNSSNPSVSFIERPDFLLNYPSLVTQTTRAWQEVAP